MADQFRNVFCIAVAHEPQARFGVEHDVGLRTAIEAQAHDQVCIAVVAARDFSTDDDRAFCHVLLPPRASARGLDEYDVAA